jgi:SAM-dependent methyltransferase
MTDYRDETIQTYNRSAKALAEYFRGIGPRKKYIDKAFELAGSPEDAYVLEIGCGDGRDAKEIVKRASCYTGFDISEELIKLAKKHVPKAKFIVADAVDYNYPKKLDIVFAFASLLHLDVEETRTVLQKVNAVLNPKGIFYISLKYAPHYKEYLKVDEHGTRMFYLYNPEIIQSLAGEGFSVLHTLREKRGQTEWFEIALQKV